MTGFVPRECLSCVDALNETFQDLFGTAQSFSEAKWSVIYSGSSTLRSAGLSHQDAERMKQAVHQLQGQLFEGERTACHVGNDGLEDVKPAIFGKENVSQIIAENGKIRPDFVGQSVTFYVRAKGYERSDQPVGLVENEDAAAGKSKGGRTMTGRDAAIVYWVRYPNGHETENVYWQAALDEVNKNLKRLDLPEVRETTLKYFVKDLAPPKKR